MKIIMIGNCHSSCFVAAWRKDSECFPRTAMSFVGSGGSWFGTIYADRRKKIIASESEVFRERIAATSGGNGKIDFRAYDVCIIAGGFDQAIVRKIGILGGEKSENYSQQLFETAVKDLYCATEISDLIPKIREISDIPISIVHNPFEALSQLNPNPDDRKTWASYDYVRGVGLVNKYVLNSFGAKLICQPNNTIKINGYTKYEYVGGVRKATQREIEAGNKLGIVEDLSHANVSYGQLRLGRIIELSNRDLCITQGFP